MSTNAEETERIYGRCLRLQYLKDPNFTFQNEKCVNEDLQNLVNRNKGFLVAWVVLFRQLWLNNKNEPVNKIREILKLLVPEQEQDRWYKGAASVLYTYVVFHKVAEVQADLKNAIEHIVCNGKLRGAQKKKSFWERLGCAIKTNLQDEQKPPLTWLNLCVTVCMAQATVPAVAIKIVETAQFTSIGNNEVKAHMAHILQKEKNIGETVAFALNEIASLNDVRRRVDGLFRNAKAYKIPKHLPGADLCHFIEHVCGLREDAQPTAASDQDDEQEYEATVDEKIKELVILFENIDTDHERVDPCPSHSVDGCDLQAPIDELSPNTKVLYDLRSPKGKRNYQQGILDGIKIANARESEQNAERDNDVNVNGRSKTPVASTSETSQNVKRPRRRLEFASGTVGVLNNAASTSAVFEKERNDDDDPCVLCGKDSPPSRKGVQIINWIDCDSCKTWFHMLCLKMKKKDAPKQWFCNECTYNK